MYVEFICTLYKHSSVVSEVGSSQDYTVYVHDLSIFNLIHFSQIVCISKQIFSFHRFENYTKKNLFFFLNFVHGKTQVIVPHADTFLFLTRKCFLVLVFLGQDLFYRLYLVCAAELQLNDNVLLTFLYNTLNEKHSKLQEQLQQ